MDQIHYDASVPGYSKESDVPQEVKDKFNKQLADILFDRQGILQWLHT